VVIGQVGKNTLCIIFQHNKVLIRTKFTKVLEYSLCQCEDITEAPVISRSVGTVKNSIHVSYCGLLSYSKLTTYDDSFQVGCSLYLGPASRSPLGRTWATASATIPGFLSISLNTESQETPSCLV
jgi:hypothetical protein